MRIEIDMSEVERLADALPRAVGIANRQAMNVALRAGERAGENAAPQRTGFLANHIEGKILNASDAAVNGEIRSAATYSSFVDKGTRYIDPRRFMLVAETTCQSWLAGEVESRVTEVCKAL